MHVVRIARFSFTHAVDPTECYCHKPILIKILRETIPPRRTLGTQLALIISPASKTTPGTKLGLEQKRLGHLPGLAWWRPGSVWRTSPPGEFPHGFGQHHSPLKPQVIGRAVPTRKLAPRFDPWPIRQRPALSSRVRLSDDRYVSPFPNPRLTRRGFFRLF